ncbi:PREDICTED: protodermal factor 1-like [Nelumbo nucifera]|uniref:Protodermal factor 1-like n=2 Tax=Nelumbo nucifera TaxID=4432 RepID=A0A822ZS98_NELNU|nr:PREDICTED: protodermal factor 1-like [Nelumbo nucifera]DAD48122.1 TPA_asm: hypothetical protein HUJ06_018059 [Nelumbo nucifera]
MELPRPQSSFFIWVLFIMIVSQNLAIPVLCRSFTDQKNYYPRDPHHGSHGTPSQGTPSHGSGGSYGGSTPTPSHGSGGSYNPPSGGGGYYSPPGHSTPVNPPSTPTPTTPTPTVPGISPPFDPNAPPPFFTGTCNYWATHPQLIWGLFGWWGTVAGIFGTPTFGTSLTLPQALTNTRTDGYSALYREGTASLLNSMVNKRFPFTTQQVKDHFAASVVSERSAADQAKIFKQANEGHLKPRA